MFETMRKVFGPKIVMLIIGSIALVFVFYGVFTPKGSQMGRGSFAAKVNGEVIPLMDFEREYRSRSEYYENMFKGKMDPSFLKKLGIRSQVLDDLVSRKVVQQEASQLGFVPSDAELREKIQELPYFKKKDEKGVEVFDPETYRSLLAANRRSPAEFEESIRKDLLGAKLGGFLQGLPKVSESELKNEFQIQENRRQIDYVSLDREAAKKRMVLPEKEVSDFLSKPENVKQAQQSYESKKYEYEKPKAKEVKTAKKDVTKPEPPKPAEYFSFEEVKRKVATDILKDKKLEEINKLNENLAKEVFEKAKSGNMAEFKNFLKAKGLELKTSDKFNQMQPASALASFSKLSFDSFDSKSELQKAPMLYSSGVNFIVALNLKSFTAQNADFDKKKDELKTQMIQRKSQLMSKEWMGEIRTKATIVTNTAIMKEVANDEAE